MTAASTVARDTNSTVNLLLLLLLRATVFAITRPIPILAKPIQELILKITSNKPKREGPSFASAKGIPTRFNTIARIRQALADDAEMMIDFMVSSSPSVQSIECRRAAIGQAPPSTICAASNWQL
ncbi:hypothetical protein BraRD5C2_55060 [Bradyrhizobium sp. RD5-C2]|nr:hypothetical protein BraRD5C2_55060 [Bradyrhizobium sp. RD5-C2]